MADTRVDIPHYKQTIKLKPSPELLPDEYPITNPKYFYVKIFYVDKFKQDAEHLEETFNECKFTVQIHRVESKESTRAHLDSLKQSVIKTNKQHRRGIMVIILGRTKEGKTGYFIADNEDEISFNAIWDAFFDMEELNRKPKLFLFQTYIEAPIVYAQMQSQFDGAEQKRLYNVAAPGADMLIIARVISESKLAPDRFLYNLWDYIKTDGNGSDLVEMIMYATSENRPLIVSTLTARVFMKPLDKFNQFRGITYATCDKVDKIKAKIVSAKLTLN